MPCGQLDIGKLGTSWRKRLAACAYSFRVHLQFYQALVRHPRTPWISKVLLGLAVAYAVSPIDLIPDFIPVAGQLDDLLILPALVWMALHFVPSEVCQECRLSAQLEHAKGDR